MNKLIVAILLLTVILGLCACSQAPAENTTTGPVETTKPNESSSAPTEDSTPAPNYFITVVDTEGQPVTGALLQMCKLGDDGACTPAATTTDAEGKVSFALAVDSYKVSFIILPPTYTYVDEEQNFYFDDGASELTIIVKKA